MFVLCGDQTRDLFRSRQLFNPLRQIVSVDMLFLLSDGTITMSTKLDINKYFTEYLNNLLQLSILISSECNKIHKNGVIQLNR
jgi:hypothetical protein